MRYIIVVLVTITFFSKIMRILLEKKFTMELIALVVFIFSNYLVSFTLQES